MLCAVSYTVAEDEWIFSSLLWISFCVSWSTPCSSLSDPWCYLQTPCVSSDFSCLLRIHYWSFVHQSSMFRVVDVLYAVMLLVIQLLSMNGFFPLCYGFFPVCHGLHRAVVWVLRVVSCRHPVYLRIFRVCYGLFPCHLLLGISASVQYVQSTWCAVSYTTAEYEWIFTLC